MPLIEHTQCNYLVLEYNGDESKRFYHLVKHLFESLKLSNYGIYEGKKSNIIQVFIAVNALDLKEADSRLSKISLSLEQKITKKWKCLPSLLLPEAYNIVTVPYKKI